MVVPNVVLFREIALHDTAPICRYCPDRFTIPRAQAPDRSRWGGVTGRQLDEDTQYRMCQLSVRSNNQKHGSLQNLTLDII